MLNKIALKTELIPFFTEYLMENGVGVIISEAMPQDSYMAIDIDKYYHYIVPNKTPAIADIILVARKLSLKELYHIYIIEMKNIKSPDGFKVNNVYEKFRTVIEDFMKIRYSDIFMDEKYQIEKFRLFFITDAYRLKKRGWTEKQINSFLLGTKIEALQSMPVFYYRNFRAVVEYKLPNPTLDWY